MSNSKDLPDKKLTAAEVQHNANEIKHSILKLHFCNAGSRLARMKICLKMLEDEIKVSRWYKEVYSETIKYLEEIVHGNKAKRTG